MQKTVLIFIILLGLWSCNNSFYKKINKIDTIEKAKTYIVANTTSDDELITITSAKDTDIVAKTLFSRTNFKAFELDNYLYKIVESKTALSFRASYIYLDGRRLSKSNIDSLRTMIIEKYNRGVSFSDLVEVYNMDGNKKDGDLGWFSEGIMVKDFENAVRNQEKGNIFTIDIPDYNWYYVTLKTDNNTDITTIRALKVRNQ